MTVVVQRADVGVYDGCTSWIWCTVSTLPRPVVVENRK